MKTSPSLKKETYPGLNKAGIQHMKNIKAIETAHNPNTGEPKDYSHLTEEGQSHVAKLIEIEKQN